MIKKERCEFRLSKEELDYLDSIGCANRTASLSKIINEHKSLMTDSGAYIAQTVVAELEKTYSKGFTRMRLATNFTDRNVKVLLEEMNTLLYAMNIKAAFTSLKGKSPVWSECEDEVKRQIAAYKEFNDNNKLKHK